MKIDLVLVDKNKKEILSKLIKEYEQELLNVDKKEEYKYLNSYWENKNRFPFFIKSNNKNIGFILINDYNLVNKDGKNIAEFYVKKEFRQKGLGKLAAIKVFDLFKGNWEIRQMNENINAQIFWRKIISEYTKGNFEELFLDNEKWRGPIQVFKN